MRSQPNIGNAAKFPGILPIYIGMEMYLTETYLPPRIGRGTPVDVVDIELHPSEPPIQGRPSIASHGCVILHYMPKHIYVRVKNCDSNFLNPGAADLKGVIAVSAVPRAWRYKNDTMKEPVSVSRTQMPLLPRKQCTLHGVQGKTADPGFIAHWSFPAGIKKESIWLAYYVSLSRPRRLSNLLSHGFPGLFSIRSIRFDVQLYDLQGDLYTNQIYIKSNIDSPISFIYSLACPTERS